MPYKDKNKQKEFQKLWMKKRREEFFLGKKCIVCNSEKKLELDHINPDLKVDHRIWGWSEEKRNEEIKKCQILCHDCHLEKSRIERYTRPIKVNRAHGISEIGVYKRTRKANSNLPEFRYEVRIHFMKREYNLGVFDSIEEAVYIRCSKIKELVSTSKFKGIFK